MTTHTADFVPTHTVTFDIEGQRVTLDVRCRNMDETGEDLALAAAATGMSALTGSSASVTDLADGTQYAFNDYDMRDWWA